MNNQSKSLQKTGYYVRLGVLLAIVAVFTLLGIGNIPIGPIVATIYHLPVIVGAVLLGTKAGAILGGFWGLLCFWLALSGQTTDAVAIAVIQQSPLTYFVIAFFPRLLCGILTGLFYRLTQKLSKREGGTISLAATGCVGSAANTVFYLGSLYLLVRGILASVYGIDASAVLGLVLSVAASNGIVEAVISAVVVSAVCRTMIMVNKRKN